jgi:hypothetical protein
MSTLKSRLKNIPDEIFDEIEQLLVNYGIEDCEVTGIDITKKDQPRAMNVTEQECLELGKKRRCKKRKNAPDYCWCAKR